MFNFLNYIREASEKLKAIQHNAEINNRFHRISNAANMEEFLLNISTVSPEGYHVLAVDNMEGRHNWNGSSFIDVQDYSFYVVKHVTSLDNDEKELAKRECKTICNKLASKLVRDQFENLQHKTDDIGLRYLDRTSFQYFTLGPIGDNFFGVNFTFLVQQYASELSYNADDWDV